VVNHNCPSPRGFLISVHSKENQAACFVGVI
jgi:hypothetical protein